MYLIWVKFIICAGLIFFAGKQVARYADAIAEKTGLSRLWIGVILVSFTTSLPELFTGIGSVVFVNAPDLTVGNLFGANSYNLLNIALIDLLNRPGPLLGMISRGQLLTAAFSLVPVVLAAIAITLSGNGISTLSIANIGIWSAGIFLSYCVMVRVIYTFEKKNTKPEEDSNRHNAITLRNVWINFCASSVVIMGCGIWLAYIGKEMSGVLGLGDSFVGTLFLGLTTTLPEITVSIAAILIGAKEIAIANMLGSNLFNMAIIFVDDVFYRKSPILSSVSPSHLYQAGVVVVMTAVIILAIATKPKKKFFNVSWYTPVLIFVFLIGALISFRMR
ncbi:MAG: hypothetical protein NG740_05705 [Omnitrophica bacterium]|nr:hypothetical protein [Candidatus Omnitrophota bacterium]